MLVMGIDCAAGVLCIVYSVLSSMLNECQGHAMHAMLGAGSADCAWLCTADTRQQLSGCMGWWCLPATECAIGVSAVLLVEYVVHLG
jgi:hypothetical protein